MAELFDANDMPTLPPKNGDSASEVLTVPPRGTVSQYQTTARFTEHESSRASVDIPGYEILGELGRGGMGVVYKARHVKLGRLVALKMILAGVQAGADELARFRTEAEAIAQLQHPNIIQIHEIGEHDGKPFFSLEYCGGGSLSHKINGTPLPCRQAAEIVETIARAMHAAHQNGIIHRDLKPANVLLLADGTPKITDFGLAKKLDAASQTQSGTVMGTPSYMAPEQADGKAAPLGPPADIYALGAILYELLTGRPPFNAATSLETVMQVLDHQPVPPRLLNPKIDHDLETICLKCLEKQPAFRYASAEELADDLRRYLNGDSIHARSFNMIDRLAHVLERDTHTADFSAWSSMVLVMAGVVGIEHLGVFLLVWTEQPSVLITAARGLQFVLLGFLFWRNRGSQLLPTTAAERELWTIWIGYFTTYFFIVIVIRMMTYLGFLNVAADWHGHEYFLELVPYPFIALVSGLAFFIMGSNYWGRCYAIGVAFFVSAPFMAMDLTLGPLIFGVIWTITLVMLGMHLREKRGMVTAAPKPVQDASSQAPTVQCKR